MQCESLSTSPAAGWGRIDVERLGGLPGYGLPGSHLRSRGHILARDLGPCDQQTLHRLFMQPAEPPPLLRDGFIYHLTRQTDSGPHTVAAAEAHVPDAIRDCVRDEILPP